MGHPAALNVRSATYCAEGEASVGFEEVLLVTLRHTSICVYGHGGRWHSAPVRVTSSWVAPAEAVSSKEKINDEITDCC